MQEAKRRIPHFTLVEEFDVTALEETRAMMNSDRGSNPKLTLLPFLITAMAQGACPNGRCSTRPTTTTPTSSPATARSTSAWRRRPRTG